MREGTHRPGMWGLVLCLVCGSCGGLWAEEDAWSGEETRYSEVELLNLMERRGVGFLHETEGTTLYSGQSTFFIELSEQPQIVNQNQRLLFAKVPGVFLEEDEGQGTKFNASMRGLPPNLAKFSRNLIDGFPLNSDYAGARSTYYIPDFSGVTQVQLAHDMGVAGGSSLGGQFQFLSYAPVGDQPWRVRNVFAVGEDDFYSDFVTVSGTVDSIGYLVYGQYATGAGYQDGLGFERRGGGFKVQVPVTEQDTLTLGLIQFSYRLNGFSFGNFTNLAAGGLTDAQFTADPRAADFSSDIEKVYRTMPTVLWVRDTEGGGRMECRGWYSYTDSGGEGHDPGRVTQQYVHYPGVETRWVAPYDIGAWEGNELSYGVVLQGSWGTILQETSLAPGLVRDMDRYDFNAAAYVETILRPTEIWSVTPGVRLEYTELGASGVAAAGGGLPYVSRSYGEVVPLFYLGTEVEAVRGDLDFQKPLVFFGNVGRNYRPFQYDEAPQLPAGANIAGGLDFPSAYQAEVGVRGTPFRWFEYSVTAYWMRIDDQVGVSAGGQVTNIGATDHRGIEFFQQLDLFGLADELGGIAPSEGPRVGPRSPATETGLARHGKLNLYANFTFQDHTVDDLITPRVPAWQVDGGRVPYSPQWIVKAGLEYNWFERLKLHFGMTSVTDYAGIGANQMFLASQAYVPGYTVLDASAEYAFWRDRAAVFLQVTNLTDESYFALRRSANVAGIRSAPDRTFSGGVRISF